MFRKMKREQQELSKVETTKILKNNLSGVLAVMGDSGYPYAVPLNYIFMDGDLYFYGAEQGHRMDSIRDNSKVSFCVIDENYYDFGSVIAFGIARVIEDRSIRKRIAKHIEIANNPKLSSKIGHLTEEILDEFSLVQLEVEHLTGKVALAIIPYDNRMSSHEENGVCFEDLLLSD